jgi:D-beta-D-heptose 7-phosphate kinase/D-beta-D-heptose 1-phosphate adenosyltransferase
MVANLNQLKPFNALVLGDFMLDTYTTGRVKRISPEAPVQVLEVSKVEARPGGAGNAVLNLLALGGNVFAIGRIGRDSEGEELRKKLQGGGAHLGALLVEEGYKTPVKNRLIADSQQLLRVDFETVSPLKKEVEEETIEQLAKLMPQVQVAAISDYGKGFLSKRILSEAIRLARLAGVPAIVDPKGIDFTKYRGCTLLKPNLSEAYAAAKMAPSSSLDDAAREIFAQAQVDSLLITRSEAGMSLFNPAGERADFPIQSKEVIDVTGAGDTVLAMMSCALANGLDLPSAIQLSNIAAGLNVERLGCVQITLPEIAGRLLELDCHTKVFDESHSFALKQILHSKVVALLVIEEGQEMSRALLRAIRRLSAREGCELVIYAQGALPQDEFVHLLSSLHEVKTIILQEKNLKALCNEIHPHEVFVFKGEKEVQVDEAGLLLTSLLSSSSKRPSLN